jgi:phosphoribosylglycinamide formyltransferase-1
MKKNIAIFASGSGTNAENIIHYFEEKASARVNLVVTNRREAYVRERAAKLGVPCFYYNKEEWTTGTAVLDLLKEHRTDWVVLAGFLLRVPAALVAAYPQRMVNIHPALLPKFGGQGMYGDRVHEAVIAAGDTQSGITIHYVNEAYDRGAVICQATCEVLPDDTPQTLAQRIHALEYDYFPRVIERLILTAPA